jgi:hypothetical protein
MFKIEKNIPVPANRNRGTSIYPFKEMKKGDSFFIPVKGEKEQQNRRKAVTASAYKHKVKITARVVDNGVRVWRVS